MSGNPIPPALRKLALVLLGVGLALAIGLAWRRSAVTLSGYSYFIHWQPLASALALAVVYRLINSCGWGIVLRGLDQKIEWRRGARIWLLSQAMRWLPGAVWSFGSRVYQATAAGVPAAIASVSMPLELLLTCMAWGIVGIAGVSLSGIAVDWMALVSWQKVAWGGGAAVALMGMGWLVLRKSRGGTNRLAQVRGKLELLRTLRPNLAILGVSVLFYTVLNVLNGVAFYLVLQAVHPAPISLTAVLAINACSWMAGLLAVGAPGGLGVREGVAILLLSSLMPMQDATVGALLWRLVQMLDEALCLGLCCRGFFIGASKNDGTHAGAPHDVVPLHAPQ